MSDKIEYSRLLMKRSTTAGEVPTIPPVTAVTLNQFTPTDIFEGEFFLNSADDLLWIRTETGILPISLSGTSGTTVVPQLVQVLNEGNYTGGFDIIVNSGDTIVFSGLPIDTPTYLLGIDGSGNTISVTGTTGGGGTNGTSGTSGSNGSDGSAGNNGSSGSSGTSGPEGSSGSSGISGTSGSSGADGSRGDSGSSGSSGISGSSGSSGLNGSSGSSGISGIDGSSGSSGISGSSGSNGLSGVNGTNGTSGRDGLSTTFFNYKAKTTIYSGDPSSGYIIWDSPIQSDTLRINISDTDQNGNNIDLFLSNLKSGSTITIQSQADHTDYQTWLIGNPSDFTTYWTIPVTLVTSTYSFSNNEDVLFIISQVPSGSSGSSGSSGVNGSNGNNGSSGSSGVSGTSGTSSTAGGGGVIGTHFEMIITGSTILPVAMSPSSLGAGYSPSQNTASLIPFIPVRDTSITGVTADVAVVGATGVFKIVCYDSSSAGFPTNLIIESSELSGATTGFKTFSTSYTFSAGTQYWIGVYGSASTAMRLRNIGAGTGLLPIPNPSTTTSSSFSVMLNYTQGTYPTVPTTLTAGPSYRSAVEQVPFMQLNKI